MNAPTIQAHNVIYYRKEGCLYYNYPSFFKGRFEKAKVSKWEESLQAKVLDDQGWKIFTPEDLVLIAPDKKNIAGKEIIEFMESIPPEIQDLAAPYQYLQIPVLRLLRHDGAQDLARQSPFIFWLLAVKSCQHLPSGDSRLVSLFRAKQRNILEQLGLIASKSAIKLLGKVKVSYYDRNMFEALKSILTNLRILESLRHYPIIGEKELFASLACPTLLNRNFFRNYLASAKTSKSEISSTEHNYSDTVRLARILRRRGFSRAIRSFKSTEQLRNMHDRLIEELNRRNVNVTIMQLEARFGKNLPMPIFPATENIVPITTIHQLVMESLEMRHCVVTYAEKVVQGKCSIYKILLPERATLEVSTNNSSPQIAQVRLFRNGVPHPKTLDAAEKWFAASLDRLN